VNCAPESGRWNEGRIALGSCGRMRRAFRGAHKVLRRRPIEGAWRARKVLVPARNSSPFARENLTRCKMFSIRAWRSSEKWNESERGTGDAFTSRRIIRRPRRSCKWVELRSGKADRHRLVQRAITAPSALSRARWCGPVHATKCRRQCAFPRRAFPGCAGHVFRRCVCSARGLPRSRRRVCPRQSIPGLLLRADLAGGEQKAEENLEGVSASRFSSRGCWGA
jgi:hypothetical protein